MLENIDLGFKPENELENRVVLPLSEIIEILKNKELSKKVDFKKPIEEYEILGEISPDNLKSLIQLNYEVELTEQNNKIILSSGAEDKGGLESGERRDSSKLSFHTHTKKQGETVKNMPSFADIYRDLQVQRLH